MSCSVRPVLPVEDWTVLASYDSAYTESAFVTEEIDFACDEDGLYSIAFVNPTAGAFFMLQSCTLTAIYDHDMRLDSYSSNLARLMPVSFTAEPEFEVTVTNRGADTEEGVKIVVRNGSTVVAESEEAILGPLESHTFNPNRSLDAPSPFLIGKVRLSGILPASVRILFLATPRRSPLPKREACCMTQAGNLPKV